MKIEKKKMIDHFHSGNEEISKIHQLTTLYFMFIVPLPWKISNTDIKNTYKIGVV